MKFLRRSLLTLSLAFVAGLLAGAQQGATTPEQQTLLTGLKRINEIFAPDASQARPFYMKFEILKGGGGLPIGGPGTQFEMRVSAPDKLHISTTAEGRKIQIGRREQDLWVWVDGKNFAAAGSPDVPKYASDPKSLSTEKMGPVRLPIPADQLALLPLVSIVEAQPDEEIDGANCKVIHVSIQPSAREALKLGDLHLRVWVRESDEFPVRLGFSDGKGTDLLIAIREATLDASFPDDIWSLPKTAGLKVERVAMSHLGHFTDQLLGQLINFTPPKPAGPADGSKRLIATHGKGRLEVHDGNRVLFLKGTPEEMGEQHGTLLKPQVKDLVNRVLYGVGVGSSFEKGEWFFGTIEKCQARGEKFVEPSALREMDALARASGHDREEIRLANFFPELFHCSGFALLGEATKGRRIFHGRVLDYMKGVGLEPNAVVIIHQPDQGNAWANVGYAGFVGSVTAMNEKHISMGEMGGRGEGNWDGKPMAELVREVMEKASTLDEALDLMRKAPRTCEYYYVIADAKSQQAVGIKATPEIFEVIHQGESHPQLPSPVKDTVLLSADDRYTELARRVKDGFGKFDAHSARDLMTRPVCMTSNIHSVLFAPDTLDFWVANSDGKTPAAHMRYTHYNLGDLLKNPPAK